MTFSWNSIKSLEGSQHKGFEELCAQLARAESPEDAEFRRKGSPDAGVECYTIMSDGCEWGWQAKYFDVLGDSQWRQLDKSVRTVLEGHPKLVRYHICVPMDRSDARSGKRQSAMQRWDTRVQKWCTWADDLGMRVEFIWWGSSELIERLSKNEHIGRRLFWFGELGFDQTWFNARLDEAVRAAGPRYTPEIHIDLPIAQDLETFSRSPEAIDKVKSLARGIRNESQFLRSAIKFEGAPDKEVATGELPSLLDKILSALADVYPDPTGELPFATISDWTASAKVEADKVRGTLTEYDREYLSQNKEDDHESTYYRSPFRSVLYHIRRLCNELERAQSLLDHAHRTASSRLMILNGAAGTGKTHLLCDFAKKRTEVGSPTILLMGQRFLTSDPPWAQAREQLDLSSIGLTEFVGALEASAQAAGCRALLIIDALNEGQGRSVWPDHIAPFLEVSSKSRWIGVLLSVRSEYKSVIIPNVPEQAVEVIHDGFDGLEYDATQAFFSHYGLEFPSTPILQPEFRNPLLLKTVCEGLAGMNERRLPRGFHGITAIFDLYLAAVNKRLAGVLDYNPSDQLVRQALIELASKLSQVDGSWLDRHYAENVVNGFLPNRSFGESLYRGLVTEGILTETIVRKHRNAATEIVHISYERFADHMIADFLLRAHLDTAEPQSAFQEGGALEFICDSESRVSPGLIEALSVQVPERVGQELISLVPALRKHWGVGEAFLQSVVWRRPDACSMETKETIDRLLENEYYRHSTLDALLTVATIEDHPMNAEFLHDRLRQDSMPDRDVWWSTTLHYAWSNAGAVRRLLDWSLSSNDNTDPDERAVELCSIVLAWTFSTSNRFLRDRATKALVSLLTGRLDAAKRLIDRFAGVDDLYVAERVYAVAYGVAMRSPDANEVGRLAKVVYDHVFATGTPPVHILLRDYARGVVERGICLGADCDINMDLVKPPYKSTWPSIPGEEEYEELRSVAFNESDEEDESHSAEQAIIFSIGNEFSDFCTYVIGKDTNWLSLRLDEEVWLSPGARMKALHSQFNKDEREAYDEYERARDKVPVHIVVSSVSPDGTEELAKSLTIGPHETDSETEMAKEESERAYAKLLKSLTPEHLATMRDIEEDRDQRGKKSAPRFDTKQIQRYALSRVFDLGWTTDRFGEFDSYIRGKWWDRDASKPERLGKKYQWIAYHEILAYIADHYQFLERHNEDEGPQYYEGLWQDSLRDIDPSCTLPSIPGGASWDGHSHSWWGPVSFDEWGESLTHQEWIARRNDIPEVEKLLRVTDPTQGTKWLNADGYFVWRQPHSPDLDPYHVKRRDLWLSCTGYFVNSEHTEVFIDWAKTVDFWGRWMPEPDESHEMFLGECFGSLAFRYFSQPYYGVKDWTEPAKGCPAVVLPATLHYTAKYSGYDCSLDDSFTLRLPAQQFVERFGLRWFGNGADFVDGHGNPVAFDPTIHQAGPSAFLVRDDLFREYLKDEGLEFCWTILGEKRIIGGSYGPDDYQGVMRISGAYSYTDGQLHGFLNFHLDLPNGDDEECTKTIGVQ